MMGTDLQVRYVALFVVALWACWLLQYALRAWSRRAGWMDAGDWRRPHDEPIARVGGLALFPVLLIGLAMVAALWPSLWRPEHSGLVWACLILVIGGVWDDTRGLHPVLKLVVQAAAALVLSLSDTSLHALPAPLSDHVIALGVWDVPLTIVAIVVLLHAVNLLEGLNGSPSVYACIIAGFLLFIHYTNGAFTEGAVLVLVLGALAGFLGYNTGRIKTFLGDTGSLLLGLIIAAELLRVNAGTPRLTVLAMPAILFGIPIIQMLRFQASRAVYEGVARETALKSRPSTYLAHRELAALRMFASADTRAARDSVPSVAGVVAIVAVLAIMAMAAYPIYRGADAVWSESGAAAEVVPALIDAGETMRALRVSEVAVERTPGDAEARYWHARSLMAAKRPDEALRDYNRLFTQGSGERATRTQRQFFHHRGRLDVGDYYASRGRLADALEQYALADVFAQDPLRDRMAAAAPTFAASRAYDRALSWGGRPSVADAPAAGDLRELIAALSHRGRWPEAGVAARRLKTMPGGEAEGAFWEGRAFLAANDRTAAVAAFASAAALGHPDAPFFHVMTDPSMPRGVQIGTLLRTAPSSLYRPFALVRALELASEAQTSEDETAKLRDLARAAMRRDPNIPMPYPSTTPGPRLLGLTIDESGMMTDEPFLAVYHWHTGSATPPLRFQMISPEHVIASLDGRTLEIRRVENAAPFGSFDEIAAGPGLPPGWPPVYATVPLDAVDAHFAVVEDAGRQWLEAASPSETSIVMASTSWIPVKPGAAYVLAVRAMSKDARLVAGWEWIDINDQKLPPQNVFNQEAVESPYWRAYRTLAPETAAYVRGTVGIYQDDGNAVFDALLIVPGEAPTLDGATP